MYDLITVKDLKQQLQILKAYKKERVDLGKAVVKNNLLPDLIALCHPESGVSHQACWILEQSFLLYEKDCYPYIKEIATLFTLSINSSGMRSLTKISSILVKKFYKVSKNKSATTDQLSTYFQRSIREQIVEGCFQEMMDHPDKTANLAWSTLTLYELGKEFEWIYPTLTPLIESILNDDPKGYRSCGSNTLLKIKGVEKVNSR
ncbi:MAG: adenylosuccinate lyase [Nonlabens sp.]|jgi:hypothetical protein|uniref:adenylosuccinate lyase n=1 Tax=Nonlabens sp. TaxID=1888209 RepID=UPI00321A6CEE